MLPRRHQPAHGVKLQFTHSTIVFVTACTKDRLPWLANDDVHQGLVEAWTLARAWRVGRYVLMPDHVHLFASPGEANLSLERWITYWKSMYGKRDRDPNHRWQPGHWDRRLRDGSAYDEQWRYVRQNPVRRALVAHEDEWPFQGELHRLICYD